MKVFGGCEEMNYLSILIRKWAIERNLHEADSTKQMLKLMEEVGELAEGMAKSDEPKVADSIGDIYVVLTILALQRGYNIEDCIEAAYEEIKYRKGAMVNGVFVKEDDLK